MIQKKITKNKLSFALVLLLAGLAGCTPMYFVPTPSEGVSIEQKYAVIRTDSLIIAVRPHVYPANTGSYSGSYFSVWYQIRNLGNQQLRLPAGSLAILADGKQYDYIPMQYILAGLRTSYLLNQPLDTDLTSSPSIFPSELEKENEQTLSLINSYLSLGNLIPGGRKEGYLFYDREILGQKQILIDVFGKQIEFTWGEGN